MKEQDRRALASIAIGLAGIALVVGGIALWSVPAALIALGLVAAWTARGILNGADKEVRK